MRYYAIEIAKADGTPFMFKSLNGQALSSLQPTGSANPIYGQANPGALQIEFDIPVANQTMPSGGAYLRIWGLGLQDIGSAANLNGCSVTVSAGMSKGLPLANPMQAGVIMQGQVLQGFSNWLGTEQTVDMLFQAGGTETGNADGSAGNFPFNWQANTPLSTAIAQTLSTAMPGVPQQISINPKLSVNHAVTGFYNSLVQFADFIKGLSQSLIGGNYGGVTIVINGSTISVFDGTGAGAAVGTGTETDTVTAKRIKSIAFQDLIGQPTWIDPLTISAKTVLRADIHVGDTVTLPPSLVAQTGSSYLRFQDKTTFSGNYLVRQAHHYGNFRQASADAWNTTFQMTPENMGE